MKKRYVLLFGATLLLLAALLWVQHNFEAGITKVTYSPLSWQEMDFTVSGSGKIRNAVQYDVDPKTPVCATNVLVEVGDYVEKGDKLIEINREETVSTILNSAKALEAFSSDTNPLTEKLAEYASRYGDNLEDAIPECYYAPESGYVSAVNISSGEISDTLNPLITISDTGMLRAAVNVREEDIASIQVGQKVTITGSGFAGCTIPGTVSKISPSAKQVLDTTTRKTVVEVLVDVDNEDNILKPGFSVNAEIATADPKQVLCVPYEAVDQEGEAEFVYIVEGNRARKKYILTGNELESGFEVISGLSPSDVVVTNPGAVPYSGALIRL